MVRRACGSSCRPPLLTLNRRVEPTGRSLGTLTAAPARPERGRGPGWAVPCRSALRSLHAQRRCGGFASCLVTESILLEKSRANLKHHRPTQTSHDLCRDASKAYGSFNKRRSHSTAESRNQLPVHGWNSLMTSNRALLFAWCVFSSWSKSGCTSGPS